MVPPRTASPTAGAALGLRERKKLHTRRAIRQSAYRLFAERGYDATSVDRIAEAAEVSPSTVFRYFPTKEDIVLTDDYDPLMRTALRERPAAEPPVTALRNAIACVLAEAYGSAPDETALRIGLAAEVPAVRARMTESVSLTGSMLAGVLAERTGRSADDLELQVCAGAMMGGLTQAMLHWAKREQARARCGEGSRPPCDALPSRELPSQELPSVIERALDVLERGLTL